MVKMLFSFLFETGCKACAGAAIHTSHTHGHKDKYRRCNTGLLDETNTVTELEGSAVTSRGTLGTSEESLGKY